MVTSSYVFDLIKSMTKVEKAYFKKYASLFVHGDENNYRKLFTAMNRQKTYDEEKLKAEFAGEKFIKQFSVVKNHLFNKILAALESYDHSPFSKIKSLVHRAEILKEKGLYREARKLIERAKKRANRYELYPLLLEINYYTEFNLALQQYDMEKTWQTLITIKKILLVIENVMQYNELLCRVGKIYVKQNISDSQKIKSDIKNILQHPLLKSELQAMSQESLRKYYEIHALCNDILNEKEQLYYYTGKLVKMYDNPNKVRLHPERYFIFIQNHLYASLYIKRYDSVLFCLLKLREIFPLLVSPRLRATFFACFYAALLHYNNQMGEFKKVHELEKKIYNGLREYGNKITEEHKITLYQNLCIAHFGTGNIQLALYWLNKIRNDFPIKKIGDHIKLINLVIHYELGNIELIPNLIISFIRNKKNKGGLSDVENHLIKLLQKLIKCSSPDLKIIELQKTHHVLLAVAKEKQADINLYEFDFISWLESKIKSKPFAEIVKEKAKKMYGKKHRYKQPDLVDTF